MTSYSFITPDVVQGTTTSWLPVTTAYPSLSGCADAFFLYPGQPAPVGWDPGYGYFAGGSLSCLPGAATTWWEQGHQNPDGYTSLSIQPITCPQAFTTAATEVRDGSSTMVMCCPSGYDLQGGQPGRVTGDCWSPLSAGQSITYTAQADNAAWVQEILTINSTTSISAVPLIGWNVAHATAVTTTSLTATAIATATATNSSSTSTPSSTRGLSTGAKAGIAVGVVLGVLAVVCLAFLCLRRRQRQQRHSQPAHFEPTPMPQEVPDRPHKTTMVEADAVSPYKSQSAQVSTRPVYRDPVELDTH